VNAFAWKGNWPTMPGNAAGSVKSTATSAHRIRSLLSDLGEPCALPEDPH